jgi:uncharacterized membrane protein YbhN (UPF0104 family)
MKSTRMEHPQKPLAKNRKSTIPKGHLFILGKIVFWGLLLYFCATFFVPKWNTLQLSHRLTTLSTPWLLVAGVITVLHYLAIFALWVLLLRRLGATPDLFLIFRAFALSLLSKYIPGKIVTYGVRTRFTLQAEVPTSPTIASFVWETVLTIGSALTVSFFGLLSHPSASLRSSLGWLLVAFGVGIGLLASTTLLGARWRKWIGFSQLKAQPRALVSLFGLYLSTWLFAGAALWCLANALIPFPTNTFFPLVIASAFSWAVGNLSVIAPAGLGVREGTLYLFVRAWLSEGDALLFVTLSRLIMFGTEVFLTIGCWLYGVCVRRR